MSSNTRCFLITAVPLLCLLLSIPVCCATRQIAGLAAGPGARPGTETPDGAAYPSRLRLYQSLTRLTTRAHQNGGTVTITQDELKRLAQDFRGACP